MNSRNNNENKDTIDNNHDRQITLDEDLENNYSEYQVCYNVSNGIDDFK